MTDNTEATAWNGVMGGNGANQEAPKPNPFASKDYWLGAITGYGVGTAVEWGLEKAIRREERKNGKP